MGLQISEIVPKKEISLGDLQNKTIAIDAFNVLYQFISTIRQPDGTPLKDSKGRITSHLSGLFYRTINLLKEKIKPIYVFDGKAPELKFKESLIREKRKEEAELKFKKASEIHDVEEMGKYAKQFSRLTEEMIGESKELLKALGIPVVQAPSEGEAQCAYMASKDEIYASASQDYDSLLFGSPRLIQNLTLARKRKLASGSYVPIKIELIELENVLNSLQISLDQLICLGILCGTDFNPGGIKGIGQKKALKIVKQYKQPVLIFKSIKQKIDFDWKEIFSLFKEIKVKKDYKIKFSEPSETKIKKILCSEHDFSEERVENALNKLREIKERAKQKSLSEF